MQVTQAAPSSGGSADAGFNSATAQPSKCSKCGKSQLELKTMNLRLKPCPCRKAQYCNTECQKEDWKRHKSECTYCRNTRSNAPLQPGATGASGAPAAQPAQTPAVPAQPAAAAAAPAAATSTTTPTPAAATPAQPQASQAPAAPAQKAPPLSQAQRTQQNQQHAHQEAQRAAQTIMAQQQAAQLAAAASASNNPSRQQGSGSRRVGPEIQALCDSDNVTLLRAVILRAAQEITGAVEVVEAFERKSRTVTPGGSHTSSTAPISQPAGMGQQGLPGQGASLMNPAAGMGGNVGGNHLANNGGNNNNNSNNPNNVSNLLVSSVPGMGQQLVQVPTMANHPGMNQQVLNAGLFSQGQGMMYPQLFQQGMQPNMQHGMQPGIVHSPMNVVVPNMGIMGNMGMAGLNGFPISQNTGFFTQGGIISPINGADTMRMNPGQ